MSTNARRRGVSGRRVVAVLFAVILATAVVPPAAAWKLNQSRIERARADVESIAARWRLDRASIMTTADRTDVACSAGRSPKATAVATRWIQAPMTMPAVFGEYQADPWGNCYMANVGSARSNGPVLVLSAGPDGYVDTRIDATKAAGDDVAVRVW